MDAIFPISALQKKQAEVKAAAQDNVVRITENGRGAYVFCTERMFEQRLKEAAEQAVYEANILATVVRGREDVEVGRVVHGSDAAWAEIEARAASRG